MFNYFIIRRKSDGAWLPPASQRNFKGATWVEPTLEGHPRLFTRRENAHLALRAWCKGRSSFAYTHFTTSFYEDEISVVTIPVPTRKYEDFEIVEFNLVEKNQ